MNITELHEKLKERIKTMDIEKGKKQVYEFMMGKDLDNGTFLHSDNIKDFIEC